MLLCQEVYLSLQNYHSIDHLTSPPIVGASLFIRPYTVACSNLQNCKFSYGLVKMIRCMVISTHEEHLFFYFVRYIHSCDTGRLEVTEIVCGGEELAVI